LYVYFNIKLYVFSNGVEYKDEILLSKQNIQLSR